MNVCDTQQFNLKMIESHMNLKESTNKELKGAIRNDDRMDTGITMGMNIGISYCIGESDVPFLSPENENESDESGLSIECMNLKDRLRHLIGKKICTTYNGNIKMSTVAIGLRVLLGTRSAEAVWRRA